MISKIICVIAQNGEGTWEIAWSAQNPKELFIIKQKRRGKKQADW